MRGLEYGASSTARQGSAPLRGYLRHGIQRDQRERVEHERDEVEKTHLSLSDLISDAAAEVDRLKSSSEARGAQTQQVLALLMSLVVATMATPWPL